MRFDGYTARKRAGERLRRQARSAARRAALRAGAQRQHARRRRARRASTTSPTCCRSNRYARLEKRAEREAHDDRAVRLPVPRAQHQGGAARQRRVAPGGADRARRRRHARRRLRRPAVLHRRGATTTPKDTPFYSTAGTEQLRQARREEGRRRWSAAAKYNGAPISILTSQQYDFHYSMALVMAEQLKRAGFKADLNVVDWATLIQRRNDPKLWDIYITHSGLLPEPTLYAAAARRRRAGLVELAGQGGGAGRVQPGDRPGEARRRCGARCSRWSTTEVPYIQRRQVQQRVGALGEARRLRRDPWPFFWNTGLQK